MTKKPKKDIVDKAFGVGDELEIDFRAQTSKTSDLKSVKIKKKYKIHRDYFATSPLP